LHLGVPLTLQATASDTDLPANTLSYSLDPAPPGMTIDPSTGEIAWNPLESQVGTHAVTVKVADNATPNLDATRSFVVTVTGEGARLSISLLAGGLIQISATGDVGVTYELQATTDFVTWTKVLEFQSTASPYLYIDPSSLTVPSRNYRLLLRQ
ncbi:MAG: Ig domain-containing protein, partial [Limisphaerales bacterium]